MQTSAQRSASELRIDRWRLSVISQKRLPGLRRQLRRSRHIFRDCRLGNFEPEHQQLAMDPGCAPQRIFPTHPPDQIAQATINPRPPCPMTRFPTPKHFEPSAMPTQDGLRLNHLHRIIRLGQSRVIHMRRARSPPRSRRRGGARRKAMVS
jgi:hypothetical protein